MVFEADLYWSVDSRGQRMSFEEENSSTPIRFSLFEEFSSRQKWQDEVDAGQHKPMRIIGDYSFPKSKEIKCGLKGCRHLHMNGYVIETADGIETHIGNRCGKKHFSVTWGELQAVYTRAKADRDREEWLAIVLSERDALIRDSQSLLQSVSETTKQIRSVLERLQKEPELISSFMRVVRAGGSIQIEKTIDSKTAEAMNIPFSKRHVFENAGRIVGVDAVPSSSTTYPGDLVAAKLRTKVIPVFTGLSISSLRNLNQRQRKDRAKEIETAKSILKDSENYLSTARMFLNPENLQELGKLPVSRKNQRTERILRQFTSMAD